MADQRIIVPEKKIITNASLADRAFAFISALKHTKGEWHGKNFELLPWQEKVVRDVFGTVKENGYRQYNTVSGVYTRRFWESTGLIRFLSAGHCSTIWQATSNTIEACCRSAAQPYTSAPHSPSPANR